MLTLLILHMHHTLELKDDIQLIRLDIIQTLDSIVNDLLIIGEKTLMFHLMLADHSNDFLLHRAERRQ